MGVRLLRSRGLLDPRPHIVEQLGGEPLKTQGEKGETHRSAACGHLDA